MQVFGFAQRFGFGFFNNPFFVFIFGIGIYVFLALSLMRIAKKTNTPYPWMAWVPVLNFYLSWKVSGKPLLWIFLMALPFVNFVAVPVVWGSTAKRLNKPGWFGILMLLPVANLVVVGILGFSEGAVLEGGAQKPAKEEKEKKEDKKRIEQRPSKEDKTGAAVTSVSFCPKCGAEIEGNDKFCSGCGSKLPKIAKQKQAKKFCDQCGAKIETSDKFCASCGVEL